MLQRKKYTHEFKIKAIELAELKRDVSSVAEDLGVDRSMIYRWKRELDKKEQPCFPGNGQKNLTIRNVNSSGFNMNWMRFAWSGTF